MRQMIKIHIQIFSAFFLTTMILALLFFTVATIQPVKAATQNLESHTFNSFNQESMISFAPPSLPFIQASSMVTRYLPILFKNPRLVYFDDFSDDTSDWPIGDDEKCKSLYDGGRYRLNVASDEECFRFSPEDAERTYGSFQATAYHSEGTSNSAYGIYINGNGAKNYYLFRISPNNGCNQGGNWEFIRNKDDNKKTIRSGSCNLNIRRGYGSTNFNTLKVKHTSNGQITLYINGAQIDTFNDSSNELKGKGTGVYARAASTKDIVIKIDDFTVFAP